MIEYSADHRTAFLNGYKFRKDLKTGYYLANKPTYEGRRERLHVYVWRTNNGDVPKDYEVHHIDGDKDNNEIDNLSCIPKAEHKSYHATRYVVEHKETMISNLEKMRPLASEWHKSDAGRAWHSKHAKEMVVEEREYICEYCGKHFKALPRGTVKYCSNGCKTKARYQSRIDNEERECVICGKAFNVNKYSRTQCCSRECAAQLRWDSINKKRRESPSL